MTSVSEALTAVRRVDARVLGPASLGCGLLLVAVGYQGVELAAVAVGLPLVLVAVVLLSARPLIVLQLMIVVEVSNATNVLEEHIPRIFHAVLALGVLTLVRLLLTSRDARRAVRPALPVAAALLGCFLFGQLLAVSVSEESAVSASVLIRYAVDGLFILVLAALMVAVRRPWAVAAAVTVSFAALGALGVLNEIVFDGAATFGGFATVSDASGELTTTLRHAGPLPDSNFWGRHLVLALPLAAALLTRALGRRRREAAAGWAAAAVAILGSVYLTQSRGTFLAVLVALVCWLLAGGATLRRRALPALGLLPLALVVPGIGDRFLALVSDIADKTSSYAADPSVLGRAAAQEIAWAMFQGKPILGVGPGAYTDLVPRFAGVVATAVLEPTDAPHNIYLQLAAESGIVGLAGWLLMFGGFAALACWASIRFGRSAGPANGDRPLAAAVLAGLVAWAFASVFLHLAYFRTVGIVFALALAVAVEARGVPASGSSVPAASARARRRVLPAAVLVAALAGTGGAVLALDRTGQPQVTVTQSVTLLPTVADPYAWNGYAYDVRARVAVIPTYAALAVDPRSEAVSAVPDPVRGTIRISVRGPDGTAARRQLDSVLAEATDRVRAVGADRSFTLAPVGAAESGTGRLRSTLNWFVIAVTAAAAGGLAAAAVVLLGRLLAARCGAPPRSSRSGIVRPPSVQPALTRQGSP